MSYSYDSWGKVLSVTGTQAETIGQINPIRYRGYYYDSETGFYYLNSRYYDPETGRFVNGDNQLLIGSDLTGLNLFAYCGNNPVNRADPTGTFWKEIGDWFKGVGKAIGNWFGSTFGAGSSTVSEAKAEKIILPDPSPITVKTGTKISKTISKHGNSSKPISVYASRNVEHPIKSSSAGVKINIAKFTLKVNLSLDNIGISGSLSNGDTSNSFGIRANVSELKIGFDSSTTVRWDANTSQTTYTNGDISGWAIAAAFILVTTGQPMPSPIYS